MPNEVPSKITLLSFQSGIESGCAIASSLSVIFPSISASISSISVETFPTPSSVSSSTFAKTVTGATPTTIKIARNIERRRLINASFILFSSSLKDIYIQQGIACEGPNLFF